MVEGVFVDAALDCRFGEEHSAGYGGGEGEDDEGAFFHGAPLMGSQGLSAMPRRPDMGIHDLCNSTM